MLRVIGAILRLPIILFLGFISFWMEFISKIALFIVAIINIGLFILMLYCGFHHDWLGIGISLATSFVMFTVTFVFYALGNHLKEMTGFED